MENRRANSIKGNNSSKTCTGGGSVGVPEWKHRDVSTTKEATLDGPLERGRSQGDGERTQQFVKLCGEVCGCRDWLLALESRASRVEGWGESACTRVACNLGGLDGLLRARGDGLIAREWVRRAPVSFEGRRSL